MKIAHESSYNGMDRRNDFCIVNTENNRKKCDQSANDNTNIKVEKV